MLLEHPQPAKSSTLNVSTKTVRKSIDEMDFEELQAEFNRLKARNRSIENAVFFSSLFLLISYALAVLYLFHF